MKKTRRYWRALAMLRAIGWPELAFCSSHSSTASCLGGTRTMTFDWNEERIETLKTLVADGLAYSLIASRFGITRNSAIAKGNRLGLSKPKRVPQGRKPRAPRPRSAFVPWVNMPKCEAIEAAPAPQGEISDPPAATRCSLVELTDLRCRWPLWTEAGEEFLFCGAPGADLSDRRPYCAFHLGRAFVGRRGHANPLGREPLDERAG